MKKNILLKILISFAGLWVLFGCATASGNKQAALEEDVAVITDIHIENDSVVIKSNKGFTYTVFKASDPYKTTIEIPDMSLGSFSSKIVSDKAGIVEIIPQQADSPRRGVKIEVVLQSPSQLTPVYEKNSLVLSIEKEPPTVFSALIKNDSEPAATPIAATEPVARVVPAAEESIQPQAKATEITGIELQKNDDTVKVIITGNGSIVPNVFPINERIVVDIPGVSLHAILPEKVLSPVKGIRAGKHKDKLRLVLDVREKTNFDVNSSGNAVEISLRPQGTKAAAAPSETAGGVSAIAKKVQISETHEMEAAPAKPVPSSSDTALLSEGSFTGKKISLDFQDADIVPIFRLLGDVSGYNIVLNPEVKGKITLKLINVPWDQALDIILRTFSLAKIVDGNIIRIVPNATVSKELDEMAKAKKSAAEAGDLETKIFPVNYADLAKVKDAIDKAKILSSRGSITLDERGSTIIVNDLKKNIDDIGQLLAEIDQERSQARQVMIEARVIEINSNYAKDLGIQWGVNFAKSTSQGTTQIGGTSLSAGQGLSGNNFLINLPAAVGAGAGGAIGLGYISNVSNLAIDLQLSAMEQLNKGKVISSPKIMTMNNQEAKITQGTTLYLPVATADKTDYKAIDALLSLTVKPRITPGGAIFMDLDITKDEPGTATAGGVNVLKNTIKTSVLVSNADTVVIGGIFKTSKVVTDHNVPGLSKIPGLGLLFRRSEDTDTSTEVLIFITPRVVEYGAFK